MVLRTKKDGKGYYIGCRSYPECKRAVWFPSGVLEASLTNETCQQVRYLNFNGFFKAFKNNF
jgi:hypothetical protein